MVNDNTDPIAYGVSTLTYISNLTTFTPINGASSSSISINGYKIYNYLDDVTGKGRRVDLSINPIDSVSSNNTPNNANRLILQALLWAGKKIAVPSLNNKLNLTN